MSLNSPVTLYQSHMSISGMNAIMIFLRRPVPTLPGQLLDQNYMQVYQCNECNYDFYPPTLPGQAARAQITGFTCQPSCYLLSPMTLSMPQPKSAFIRPNKNPANQNMDVFSQNKKQASVISQKQVVNNCININQTFNVAEFLEQMILHVCFKRKRICPAFLSNWG